MIAVTPVLVGAAIVGAGSGATAASRLILAMLLVRLPLALLGIGTRRLTYGRLALDDQLPADVWAGALALPVATSVSSALAGLGVSVWTLTVGELAPLDQSHRAAAACVVLASAVVAVGFPVLIAHRISLHR